MLTLIDGERLTGRRQVAKLEQERGAAARAAALAERRLREARELAAAGRRLPSPLRRAQVPRLAFDPVTFSEGEGFAIDMRPLLSINNAACLALMLACTSTHIKLVCSDDAQVS